MVSVNGKYELADLQAAQALHARPGKVQKWVISIVLGLLVLILVIGFIFALAGYMSWSFFIFPAFLMTFLGLYWFVLRPNQIKRAYTQHKELSSNFEMQLDETGYHIKNDYGTGNIPWKDFAKWKSDGKIILLYRTDNMFNMVPKRLLEDESQTQFILQQLALNQVKEASQVKYPLAKTLRTAMWVVLAIAVLVLIYTSIK